VLQLADRSLLLPILFRESFGLSQRCSPAADFGRGSEAPVLRLPRRSPFTPAGTLPRCFRSLLISILVRKSSGLSPRRSSAADSGRGREAPEGTPPGRREAEVAGTAMGGHRRRFALTWWMVGSMGVPVCFFNAQRGSEPFS
jgi:hypothetical protein